MKTIELDMYQATAVAAAKEADFKKIESAYLHLCGLHNILENRSENID